MSIGIPTQEVKAETETHPITTETRISKYSIYREVVRIILGFLLTNSF